MLPPHPSAGRPTTPKDAALLQAAEAALSSLAAATAAAAAAHTALADCAALLQPALPPPPSALPVTALAAWAEQLREQLPALARAGAAARKQVRDADAAERAAASAAAKAVRLQALADRRQAALTTRDARIASLTAHAQRLHRFLAAARAPPPDPPELAAALGLAAAAEAEVARNATAAAAAGDDAAAAPARAALAARASAARARFDGDCCRLAALLREHAQRQRCRTERAVADFVDACGVQAGELAAAVSPALTALLAVPTSRQAVQRAGNSKAHDGDGNSAAVSAAYSLDELEATAVKALTALVDAAHERERSAEARVAGLVEAWAETRKKFAC